MLNCPLVNEGELVMRIQGPVKFVAELIDIPGDDADQLNLAVLFDTKESATGIMPAKGKASVARVTGLVASKNCTLQVVSDGGRLDGADQVKKPVLEAPSVLVPIQPNPEAQKRT